MKEMICSIKMPALDLLLIIELVHTKPIAVADFDVTLVRLFTAGTITKRYSTGHAEDVIKAGL